MEYVSKKLEEHTLGIQRVAVICPIEEQGLVGEASCSGEPGVDEVTLDDDLELDGETVHGGKEDHANGAAQNISLVDDDKAVQGVSVADSNDVKEEEVRVGESVCGDEMALGDDAILGVQDARVIWSANVVDEVRVGREAGTDQVAHGNVDDDAVRPQ